MMSTFIIGNLSQRGYDANEEVVENFLILEDGDYILLEDGDKIELE